VSQSVPDANAAQDSTGAQDALVVIDDASAARYWRANVMMLFRLLSVWCVASLVLGILFVEPLNAFRIAGFPLGFWFAHQGSIYVFIVLILCYAIYMDRLERRLRGS